MFTSNGHSLRFRQIAGIVVLPLLIFLILVGSAVRISENNREAERQRETILQIQCTAIQSQEAILTALAKLERRLGIPTDFEIPEVPKTCEGL